MLSKKNKVILVTILVIFSVYSFLALASFDVGILGELIKNAFLFLFGVGAYILPFYIAYLSYEIYTFQHPGRFRSLSRITGITLWFLIFLTISQWKSSDSSFRLNTGEFGGWMGLFLFRLLNTYLGTTGMFLVLLLLSFVSTFIIGEGKWVWSCYSFFKGWKKFLPHLPTLEPEESESVISTPFPKKREVDHPRINTVTVSPSPTVKKENTLFSDEGEIFETDDLHPSPSEKSAPVKPVPEKRKSLSFPIKKKITLKEGKGWSFPDTGLLKMYPGRAEKVTREEIT
ncbi:MAG: DNA translocase FtsK 4TM domain-containing protein, partial [Atribacterota bacterium]